ncbi:hypothetical protein [Albidovulum sp.]|uniref:hypothetical protein n=1 Tax=Albidovulum sp. TaxID=1872424 RepID=UPI0039B84733
MCSSRALILLSVLLATGLPLGAETTAEEPLSAIDWLSRSVATPAAMPPPVVPAEPPVTSGVSSAPITMVPIDGPSLDAIGLSSVARTGLPRDLWGTTASADLARMIRTERVDTLPAVQSLLYTLLLAELTPPADSDGQGTLFLARIDKLLDLGALDPGLSLLELVDNPPPEVFRRWFDVALLTGEEDRACEVMRKTPGISPTFPARVFCLARGGDWNAAALSLRTGETLGYIEPEMVPLLERFLDPALADEAPDLPEPVRPSPLVLRLMEAIGQPLQTSTLPLAFAQADLRSNAGWKTRLEAAERLARTGAIEPNLLLGLYTERQAAASGGVWERVRAIQALDASIGAGDRKATALALSAAWRQMTDVELEVPFAALYGKALSDLALDGDAGALAFRIGLLSNESEAVARARKPADGDEAFLIGLAEGDATGTVPPDQMGAAIQAAFIAAPSPTPEFKALQDEHRTGEALLRAIDQITDGARGDLRAVTEGLVFLRHVGLETPARRAALELVLLERRG